MKKFKGLTGNIRERASFPERWIGIFLAYVNYMGFIKGEIPPSSEGTG